MIRRDKITIITGSESSLSMFNNTNTNRNRSFIIRNFRLIHWYRKQKNVFFFNLFFILYILYELISLYDVSYGIFLSLRSFVFISCWLNSCGRLLYYVYVFYRKYNSSMGSTNCTNYRFLIHAKKLAYGLPFSDLYSFRNFQQKFVTVL